MVIKKITITNLKIHFVLFPLLLILSACGGGGGGGGTTRTLSYTSAADFKTTEYNTQEGLEVVKAASMYYNGHNRWYNQAGGTGGNPTDSAAGTGVGIKIAVADSGITPAEASTGTSITVDAANSYDYVNNISGSTADDNNHGTHVAGIIAAPKNSSGMHGIAYNASVINFKIANAAGSIVATDAQIKDKTERAYNAGAYIINNSWGSSTRITETTESALRASIPLSIEGYQTFVARGGVAVWATGNAIAIQPSYQAGMPHLISGLQDGWLAVMAVDLNGNEPIYTNRCGVAAAWCIAAPGGSDDESTGGIYSMVPGGGYNRFSGTSMAAPHVSGAIAGLKSMFPNLTYQEVRSRLLETANSTGLYANSAIFGHGLMDLDAASSVVGTLLTLTGSDSLNDPNSKYMSLSDTSFISSASFSNALKKSLSGKYLEVYDSFDRAGFKVELNDLISSRSNVSEFNATSHFNRLKPKDKSEIYLSPFGQTEATYVNGQLESNLFTSYNNFLAIGYNQDTNSFLKNEKTNLLANDKLFSKNYFNNPYFYDEGGSNLFMSINNNQSGLDTFMNANSNDLGFAMKFNSGEKSNEDGLTSNLEFSFGVAAENKKFLNSSTSGAFATEDFSNTNFLGLKYNKTIKDLNFVSSMYLGQTFINEKENSYLSSAKPIYTSSLTAGVIKDNFYDPSQKIGFVISQPQKVEKGEISLNVPTNSNDTKKVSYNKHNVNLKPDARQVNLDLIFEKNITEMENLKLGLTHVQNADHTTESKNQNFISAYWQKRF